MRFYVIYNMKTYVFVLSNTALIAEIHCILCPDGMFADEDSGHVENALI